MEYHPDNIHYRVCVINDYKETTAYMEYHSYGNGHLQIFNCSVSSGVHRGWNLSSDHIFVFLNYKQLGKFKDKASAKSLLNKLINECPRECKRDFEEHSSEILKALE